MPVFVHQSANDKRLYRQISLSNGLQALLISDPETKVDNPEDTEQSDDDHLSDGGDEGHTEDEVAEKMQLYSVWLLTSRCTRERECASCRKYPWTAMNQSNT